jgi:dolichol-phosphate mannosyltransferase
MISIIIPTYNERENIADIVRRSITVLDGAAIGHEILVIDDASADNTADIAKEALGAHGRVIRRVTENRGLSESVLEGIAEVKGEAIIVMDADGSHPPELIPAFIRELNQGSDLVVASRYIPGGGVQDFPLSRQLISRFACLIGRIVTGIKDNTSGFFCVKKSALNDVNLTPHGFKIGLEIFVKANINKSIEIPFIFINRKKGESKLKPKQIIQFIFQLFSLLNYRMAKHKAKC